MFLHEMGIKLSPFCILQILLTVVNSSAEPAVAGNGITDFFE